MNDDDPSRHLLADAFLVQAETPGYLERSDGQERDAERHVHPVGQAALGDRELAPGLGGEALDDDLAVVRVEAEERLHREDAEEDVARDLRAT